MRSPISEIIAITVSLKLFSYLYLTNKMALDKVFYDKYDFDVWRMNLEGYTTVMIICNQVCNILSSKKF